MNRRNALAAAAAISLSITGLAAAAGATMHVFDVADASPNVGKVSPVNTSTTRPPDVERHVVVVDDPPAAGPVEPVQAPVRGSSSTGGRTESPKTSDDHRPAAAAPATSAPTVAPATHEVERELGDD